jgi:hypothetical protein
MNVLSIATVSVPFTSIILKNKNSLPTGCASATKEMTKNKNEIRYFTEFE